MSYDAQGAWSSVHAAHQQQAMSYPSEYLIRLFKGRYPNHEYDKPGYADSRLLDVSCGDGRDIPMLLSCGFKEVCGTEISSEIVEKIRENLAPFGVSPAQIQVGFNHELPFGDAEFDYLISWNACYYMQDRNFEDYVTEFARVMRPGGNLALSIPKKTCFIYRGSTDLGDGYRRIEDDFFDGVRNGERMRCFEDEAEIEAAFSSHFDNFTFASIHDDCFGLNYHWHLATARRK